MMLKRFLTWLQGLPLAMRSWPERFCDWAINLWWDFVDWVKDLPRRIKEGFIALVLAFRDLFVACYFGVLAFFAAILGGLNRFFSSPIQALQVVLDPDPASIRPERLTIRKRGRKIALFSRQLASMTHGGVSLLQSVEVLGEQADDLRLAYVTKEISGKLSQGFSLSKATSLYPKIFPPVFPFLIRAGESTGRLVTVIERLADLLEKEEDLIKQVKGALSYPIFVLVLTMVLTLGLFSTVLPGFADFYKDFNVPLPVITGLIMTFTGWVQSVWFWLGLILSIFAVYFLFKKAWEHTEHRLIIFHFLLLIPLVGPIIRFSCLARFCWVLELTQDAGLDLVRSVNLACMASGSAVLQADFNRLSKGITEGDFLSELMSVRPEVYPNLLQQMTMMGEETSQTKEGFGRSGTWFEQDVQSRVESFQAALEPILMGMISVVVGTIVLAVFLPLYGLLDKLGV